MKKLALSILALLCLAVTGFSQTPCSVLNASMNVVQNGNAVTVTNTSTYATGPNIINSHYINWGNGQYGTGSPATHTYLYNGTYIMYLVQHTFDSTAVPIVNCSDTAYQQIVITNATPPPCSFTANSTDNGNGNYTFTASSNTTGLSYTWDFGDGSATTTGNSVSHTYANYGTYNVLVAASGVCGTTYDSLTVVYTPPCAVNANMNINQNGSIVTVSNTSTYPTGGIGSNISTFSNIDWGDGHTGNIAQSANHTYQFSGVYNITLFQHWKDSNTVYNTKQYCSDFYTQQITVTSAPLPPLSNFIDGNVYYDTTLTILPLSFKVWLIKKDYDSLLSAIRLTAIDSIITSPGYNYYNFNYIPSGIYLVKAAIAPNTTNPGLVPTYHTSSINWSTADTIYHTLYSVSKDIYMQNGTPTSGPGFIGGLVTQGAGKGTANAIPDQLIFLLDNNNNLVAHTYTDNSGQYSFANIPNGTYTVHPESMNWVTIPYIGITVSNGNVTHNGIDFEKNSKTIQPKTTSVEDINHDLFSVYPNPTNGVVNINWKNGHGIDANIIVSDVTGRIIKTIQTTTTPINRIDLSAYQQGVYFIHIQTDKGSLTQRIVLQ